MKCRSMHVSWLIFHLLFTICACDQTNHEQLTCDEDVSVSFKFRGYQFPILYDGEEISVSEKVKSIDFFLPLFGKERKCVNPSLPFVIGSKTIKFTIPGEYYLRVNKVSPLKVLVLSKKERFSSSIVRLFHFISANMFYGNAPEEEKVFNNNKDAYIRNLFHGESPAILLCGPSHILFRKIIADRLKLPTRIVTFPGAYRWGGKIYTSSHNLPEVYLPDLKKWVVFDLNYGFFVQWMSALELADFFHRNSSGESGLIIVDKMMKLNVNTNAPVLYWSVSNLMPMQLPFTRDMVSRIPTSFLWRHAFRFYYSGAAYWGRELEFPKPTGTEFLPGEYVFVSLHETQELTQAAIDYIRRFDIEPTIVSSSELQKMLDVGHSEVISKKAWLRGLPK